MHGKTLQVSKLLAGLILIYIAGFCRAKHNFVGRDNGITNMTVTVGKGILCIFRTSGGLKVSNIHKAILDFQYFLMELNVFSNIHCLYPFFQMRLHSQQWSRKSLALVELEVLVGVVVNVR